MPFLKVSTERGEDHLRDICHMCVNAKYELPHDGAFSIQLNQSDRFLSRGRCAHCGPRPLGPRRMLT